jgi:membrane protein
MNASQVWGLMKNAVSGWVEHRAWSEGAALSYYTAFSIAPLLLIVIAVAGLVFGEDAARGAIVQQLQGMVSPDAAKAVESLLQSASKPSEGIVSTVIGVALLVLGATTVLAELQSALDTIWQAPQREQPSGVWSFIRTRIVTVAMVLGIGFLLLVSLVVSTAIAALGRFWDPMFGGWEVLANVFNLLVSFVLVTALFAMIYKFLPHVAIRWHDVWVGSAVTAVLFTLGKFLIGLYIGKGAVASGFGAAGSLVVLLVWVYYSAQIFLLGAEFAAVYARTHGSLSGQTTPRAQAMRPEVSGPSHAPAGPLSTAGSAPGRTAHVNTATMPAHARPALPESHAFPTGRHTGLRGRLESAPVPWVGGAMLAGAASVVLAGALMRHRRGEPLVRRRPPAEYQRATRRRYPMWWGPVIAALMRKTQELAR